MEATDNKGEATIDKIYVSTLDVRGYDLIVVGPSKAQNEKNLIAEAAKFQPQWHLTEVKNFYKEEIRTEEVEEFGKVIYP